MLHAVNSRKARLNAFRAAGQRVPIEDVVTSTVFGPLAFLDAEEAGAAVCHLLSRLGVRRPDWTGPIHLQLWPRHFKMPRELRTNYVEPDLVITDQDGATLIVEVKWGAPLSPRELAAQWLSLSEDQRRRSAHLLLVLEPHPYREAVASDCALIEKREEGEWPLFTRSWREAADAFRAMAANPQLRPGTRRWADGVYALLRREDPGALVGWSSLGLVAVDALAWRARSSALLELPLPPALSWRFQ